MSYTPGIPNASDLISDSQSQIRTNFVQLNTQFAIDHTAFDAASNNGKHKKVTLIEQASAPTTSANEMALYTKESATISELFLRRESNGVEIQMSFGAAATGANTAKSINNFQTFLPGGFLIKSGTSSENATSRTIIFTTDANLTAFNTIYAVFVSPLTTTDTARVNAISNTQFSMITSTGPLTVYWWAIGI